MTTVRSGGSGDLAAVAGIDPVARRGDLHRREAIGRWLATGQVRLAVTGPEVAGYCALEYTFFDQGFVTMLMVAENARRQGVGRQLLTDAARQCRTSKLFTSTNLSNHPMQHLLTDTGWRSAGIVYGLDENDPELFFTAPAVGDGPLSRRPG